MEDFKKILKKKLKNKENLVENLLPQGITNFSGDPKVGKTYFLLQMSLALANNTTFLNHKTFSDINKILYYSTETNEVEMQRRGKLITQNLKTGKFKMDFNGEIHINDIEKEILKNKKKKNDVILVIIDTSENTKFNTELDMLNLQDAYKSMTAFKRFNQEYNASFILVRHNVKNNSSANQFNAISGSVGITASAETNFVLFKDSSNDFRLVAQSRYLPEFEINLTKDNDGFFKIEENEILIKTDDVDINTIIKFLARQENQIIEDTSTNIVQKANLKFTTPNILYKKLCENEQLLKQCNISFKKRRSNGKNLIKIELNEEESEETEDEM